jgi:hypothetical protein
MTPIFSSTPARVFDIGNFPRHFFHTTSVSKPANEEDAQKDVEPAMDIPDTKTVPNGVEGSPSKIASEKNPEQQESLLAGVDVSKKKLCGVCNQNEGKYKCSRCYLPSYASLSPLEAKANVVKMLVGMLGHSQSYTSCH